jgi:hypothetical protein
VPGRQIDFPEKQKHVRGLDAVLWGIAAVCILFVLIAIFTVSGGSVPTD